MNEFLKKLASIEEEAPDEMDLQMIKEAEQENDGTLYALDDVIEENQKAREERKRGDLHVRISASLHDEIAENASREGVSLNQYVVTALAYFAGRESKGN